MKDMIVLGIIVAVIILTMILARLVSSKNKKKETELLEEEADFYCDLYYDRMIKEAEAKYKVYLARNYNDRLPNPVEAIGKDKQMQELLDRTTDFAERKTILEEYLPNITLALVRCKAEGLDEIPKKEAAQMKKLMKEYRLASNNER